jgi:hypothetical protein
LSNTPRQKQQGATTGWISQFFFSVDATYIVSASDQICRQAGLEKVPIETFDIQIVKHVYSNTSGAPLHERVTSGISCAAYAAQRVSIAKA